MTLTELIERVSDDTVVISEAEVFSHCQPDIPLGITWPIALERAFKAHGLRYKASGVFVRAVELLSPVEVWFSDAQDAWIIRQPRSLQSHTEADKP